MSVYTITFSPTGGTQKVTNCLVQVFGPEIQEIDLTNPATDFGSFLLNAEDICVVSVPSFGGRVPGPAISRLSNMNANGARAVLVAVYGNRAYEDTLLELKDTLVKAGFHCVAAVAAVAEHSIIHQFASGRPDQEDLEELDRFAHRIKEAIETGTAPDSVHVPGNTPYREYNGVPLKPKAGKNCTSCGLCAEKCPVGAIPVDNPSRTDAEACISCMRCVSICPAQARTLNKLLLTGASQKLKKVCSEPKKNELFLN